MRTFGIIATPPFGQIPNPVAGGIETGPCKGIIQQPPVVGNTPIAGIIDQPARA